MAVDYVSCEENREIELEMSLLKSLFPHKQYFEIILFPFLVQVSGNNYRCKYNLYILCLLNSIIIISIPAHQNLRKVRVVCFLDPMYGTI